MTRSPNTASGPMSREIPNPLSTITSCHKQRILAVEWYMVVGSRRSSVSVGMSPMSVKCTNRTNSKPIRRPETRPALCEGIRFHQRATHRTATVTSTASVRGNAGQSRQGTSLFLFLGFPLRFPLFSRLSRQCGGAAETIGQQTASMGNW